MINQPKLHINKMFSAIDREKIYDVIFHRRDVRHFRPDPIPNELLQRMIYAAHAAPSVGYMQPWNFIVLKDMDIRKQLSIHFQKQNTVAAKNYSGQRLKLYDSLKLEGILESPLNLVVTYNPNRGGPHVLGQNTMPETGGFSVCCAIQNFWLAARAENIGVGWVSIIEPDYVKSLLCIPEPIQLIAYLCVGYPQLFSSKPELEQKGWRQKVEIDEVCFENLWNQKLEYK